MQDNVTWLWRPRFIWMGDVSTHDCQNEICQTHGKFYSETRQNQEMHLLVIWLCSRGIKALFLVNRQTHGE